MKIHLECIPCFINQAIRAARLVGADADTQTEIVSQCLYQLKDFSMDINPLDGSLGMQEIVCLATNINDPYEEIKKQSNQIILEKYDTYKELIRKSISPLETAARLAIAGNIIDYGAFSDFNIDTIVPNALKQEIRLNDLSTLITDLHHKEIIYYFADNSGEIIFDRLLLETIIQETGPKKIFLIVKGFPILNDAMETDAQIARMEDIPGLEIIPVKTRGFARHWEQVALPGTNEANAIKICKGQANYESFSEYPGNYFLLLVKCDVIRQDISRQSNTEVSVGDVILWRN